MSSSSSITATQSLHSRGLLISLLVLAILNLPLPYWNCVNGFSGTEIFGFDNQGYTDRTTYDTIAGLGLAFGLVTLSHGIFGLVKITIFSIDIDGKLSSKSRSAFINACLSEYTPRLYYYLLTHFVCNQSSKLPSSF
jgi:hypothetical protein